MKPLRILVFLSFAMATSLVVPEDFSTIQEGIDSASEGDTVLVLEGIYYENIYINQKSITILSENGNENTIIDGSMNGPVFEIINVEYSNLIINGFTIQNGQGKNINGTTFGGGIITENSNLVLDNLLIQNNTAFAGGGICFFATNFTNKHPILSNLTIRNNHASEGGGIFCVYHDLTIYNSEIDNNGMDLFGSGGGIQCLISSMELFNVIIKSNQSNFGGGIYLGSSFGDFNNVLIENNYSDSKGGGIWVGGNSNLNLYRTIISDNQSSSQGGGVFVNQAILNIINSNIVYNINQDGIDGSGIYVYDGNSFIKNSIIYFNQCVNNSDIYCNLGTPLSDYNQYEISYSNIEGSENYFFDNNISLNPMFVNYNYNLNFNSPCIDSGDPNSTADPDGTIADMGAFYFHQQQLGDINLDNEINIVDIVLLVQIVLGGESTENQLLLSDFNQDGEVNIVDIVQLVNYILNQ